MLMPELSICIGSVLQLREVSFLKWCVCCADVCYALFRLWRRTSLTGPEPW